ncbi:glycogen synthase [Nanchangia anserum]|uniref:Glycogen synthase n=1 Tax=Nanchangia anserum TaxID=2692125 RepID=A0A8I0KTI6_9ACTO|nr:glycogen synthase [Nanchangia anserum]MBD3688658.1 glycogen synthase [Nanchangia anserum]QOX82413.1 glycogen synthase [Nanchangia anserum]
MRVDLLSREFPPHVYGGAGVHVTELAKVLRDHVDVHVHAFDGPRCEDGVTGYDYCAEQADDNAALKTLGVDLCMAQRTEGADLVHSHTWYANMAGHWSKLMHDIPHVVTAHSLEPLRPWKAEQLGGGYRVSSWAEKTAYEGADAVIAVSHGMRDDILRCYPSLDPDRVRVIHNGLDLDDWALPSDDAAIEATLAQHGIDRDAPTVAFVGRITRQKGLPHLLRALRRVPEDTQIVLCAGAPDTEGIKREVDELVAELREERSRVILIPDMLPHDDVVNILSQATVFVTPSVYEPMGIVNLEAAAMELPVVGTKTGGIPDCIDDGVTGYLVPIDQKTDGTGTPLDPEKFEADMAERINALLADPELARRMGKAGRARVEEHFTWTAVAEETVALYRSLV